MRSLASLLLCLQKIFIFLLEMFFIFVQLPDGNCPRVKLRSQAAGGARAVNGGPQRSEEDLDGAQRAVISPPTAWSAQSLADRM